MLAVDHGEAVAAGVDEEAFEAGDAGASEREDVGLVVGDGAAPCGPVDDALAVRRLRALASSAATVVVSGRQFSGMSTSVV